MQALKRILLVEDDPKDIELTLSALDEYNLANEIMATRDGVGGAGLSVPQGGIRTASRRESSCNPARSQNAQAGRRPGLEAAQGG
jgi:hypothetical protein